MTNITLIKYLILFPLLLITLADCTNEDDQFSNNSLVGLWVESTDPAKWDHPRYSGHCQTVDGGIGGTWLFEKDGSFRMDLWYGSIAGATFGYSSGTYVLISDSVLVLDVADYNNFSIDDWDILNVSITDTLFISRSAISINAIHSGGCKLFWERML